MKKLISTIAVIAALGVFTSPSNAFFQTTDRTEAYTVLPNESAFWIPDVGNNKDSQAHLDSEAYYEANRIAVKRFVIPHHKLSGTGGTAWFSGPDSYVPDGRLILVDRTPQSREWRRGNAGTSDKDESFPCQSKEGLNIEVSVSIGVAVKEENASKYLYNFGVLPPTYIGQDGKKYLSDRSAPETIFTSVYYGRSLHDVTDDVVRKKIQTLVCNQVGSRDFDTVNAEMTKMMDQIEKDASKYLGDYGITLTFIGYSDTLHFDDEVQHAINQKYQATALTAQMKTLQDLNNLRVQEGLAKGLETHGLPVVIPSNLLDLIKNLAAPK